VVDESCSDADSHKKRQLGDAEKECREKGREISKTFSSWERGAQRSGS